MMEKTTRILNVCTLILMVLTGLYLHVRFEKILSGISLILLWGAITLLVSLQLEYTFEITKRLQIRSVE